MLTRSLAANAGSRAFTLLSAAALAKEHQVAVVFTADGVYQCLQRKKKRQMESEDLGPRLQALTQGGAECVASYSCLEARGIEINEVCSGVRVVTLEEIARLMGQVDQVVCL